MKKFIKPLFTLLITIIFIGCGEKKKSRGLIGATCMNIANPFFKVIEESMRDEAAKHGYDLIYLGCEMDISKQQKQIQDFLAKGVVAVAVNPKDSKAIGTAVKECNDANVPVFSFDVRVQAPDTKVVSHVGTDNFQGGELAGEAMIKSLGEAGGKVVVIDFRAAESCIERVKGFKKVIDAYNAERESGKIEIAAELAGDGLRDKGFKAAEDALQQVPDMRGLFAINDPSGLGAVGALEKAGKLDQVTVIAFDGMPAGKQAIKDGKIYADPVQHPDKIGRECIRAIVSHLSGEEVQPNIDIPASLYTKETADADKSLN